MRLRDRVCTTGLAALSLAGCGGAGEAPVAKIAETPVAVPAARASVVLPDAITLTTNEPFFAAAIEGDVLRLSGVDMPERRMAVFVRDDVAGGRRWQARDAAGTVVATVTQRACEDDMSGAAREFSGELRIAGRVARGCAFRTPENVVPPRFVGRWDRDVAACARPATSIEGVTITARELRFHESLGRVQSVTTVEGGVAIVVDYDGEGERWTARQQLTIDGDRLTIAGEGAPVRRVRCPPA